MDHQTKSCHVVALPYPMRSYINTMLNICTVVVEKNSSIHITFILTEEWLELISKEKLPNIQFATMSNVLPSERVPEFGSAVLRKMRKPVESLLDSLPISPTIMMSDKLPWADDVAAEKNMQNISIWPMSAAMFNSILELSVHVTAHPDSANLHRFLRGFIEKLKHLVLTTFDGIEAETIDAIKQKTNCSVYNIAPATSYSRIKEAKSSNTISRDTDEYLEWLDLQPCSSVLYVSFGSFLTVSKEQRDEIYAGLCESGVRFLWVERGETLEICEEVNGLIVPWCDQLQVLCHKSVGGYWTHCGWNSTKEALLTGVPMLTFPLLGDQPFNAIMIVDNYKVGWRMGRDLSIEGDIVKRDDIVEIVRWFMEIENRQRKELSRNARNMQITCEKEFVDGGSFERNVDDFVNLLLEVS